VFVSCWESHYSMGVDASGVSAVAPALSGSTVLSPTLEDLVSRGVDRLGVFRAGSSSMLAVAGPLGELFPEGGIPKGAFLGVTAASGGFSVALTLAGEVTKSRGWVAVCGLASLGLAAAEELGVDLERLVMVPSPGSRWVDVMAALIDGFDMVLTSPCSSVSREMARRLAARARQRGSVVVLMDPADWPESPDFVVTVLSSNWEGPEGGYGCLGGRRMDIRLAGRRARGRSLRRTLWLPPSPLRFGPEASHERGRPPIGTFRVDLPR